MPARRELHTGRHNPLHRSRGPREPLDDSVPEMLKKAGVYTHLITDHQHYWEDSGATFHNRFNSYEFFRVQEGDAWMGNVADPDIPTAHGSSVTACGDRTRSTAATSRRRPDHPQTKVFDAGIEFLQTNGAEDNWLVQIECLDPHEPFFSYADDKSHDDSDYTGAHVRDEYAALLSRCDNSLGRVLDQLDANQMWDDTYLTVCTDHGFLLGEHGWWG